MGQAFGVFRGAYIGRSEGLSFLKTLEHIAQGNRIVRNADFLLPSKNNEGYDPASIFFTIPQINPAFQRLIMPLVRIFFYISH